MRASLKLVLILLLVSVPAIAEGETPSHDAAQSEANTAENKAETGHGAEKNEAASPDEKPIGDPFCDAIVDPAREQRYLLKQKELEALLKSVNERITELEKRKAEYEEWVRRREEFAKRATTNLVEIYASMKPEAAAARLSELPSELAASLLLAVSPRQASAILNEMDEKVAADLTSIMSASARKKDPS